MDADRFIQRYIETLEGPAWIGKLVEVRPGVLDSKIVYATPEVDRLYGYVWPDTLVGRRVSEVKTAADAQIGRQYSVLRHCGLDVPQQYVAHGLHPNGKVFRVVKHVEQKSFGRSVVWVTHHEKWHRGLHFPFMTMPTEAFLLLRLLLGEKEMPGNPLLAQQTSLLGDSLEWLQRAPFPDEHFPPEAALFTYDKITSPPAQEKTSEFPPPFLPPTVGPLPQVLCRKCQHAWTPRKAGRPELCPKCKNPKWWEPRQRRRKGSVIRG